MECPKYGTKMEECAYDDEYGLVLCHRCPKCYYEY